MIPDRPGRWRWRTADGRETVYHLRWDDAPGFPTLITTWADGHPAGAPFMPTDVAGLASLTYADGRPMGAWVEWVGHLPA